MKDVTKTDLLRLSGRLSACVEKVEQKGTGDVSGPGSAADGNIAVFDGATGKAIKDSGVNIEDLNNAIPIEYTGRDAYESGIATRYTGFAASRLVGHVYEVCVEANPNLAGSSIYRAQSVAHLAVTRRWTGSAVHYYIYTVMLSQFAGGSSAQIFALSANLDGESHVANGTAQMRILVSGFHTDPQDLMWLTLRKIH